MSDITDKCKKCGNSIRTDQRFCARCGSDLLFQKKVYSGRFRISIRWVIFSFIAIFIFDYMTALITGQMFLLLLPDAAADLEMSFLISSLGSLAGLFTGSLYSSYMSPGLSLKEPVLGAALEVLISQVLILIISGSFSYLFIIRIIITLGICIAGAAAGAKLQRRKYSKYISA